MCRGNLSPLSTGWTPQQAMDLDAAAVLDAPAYGSGSSPHTTTHNSVGDHSQRYGAASTPTTAVLTKTQPEPPCLA